MGSFVKEFNRRQQTQSLADTFAGRIYLAGRRDQQIEGRDNLSEKAPGMCGKEDTTTTEVEHQDYGSNDSEYHFQDTNSNGSGSLLGDDEGDVGVGEATASRGSRGRRAAATGSKKRKITMQDLEAKSERKLMEEYNLVRSKFHTGKSVEDKMDEESASASDRRGKGAGPAGPRGKRREDDDDDDDDDDGQGSRGGGRGGKQQSNKRKRGIGASGNNTGSGAATNGKMARKKEGGQTMGGGRRSGRLQGVTEVDYDESKPTEGEEELKEAQGTGGTSSGGRKRMCAGSEGGIKTVIDVTGESDSEQEQEEDSNEGRGTGAATVAIEIIDTDSDEE